MAIAHDVFVVAIGQVILPQRRKTALHHRRTARPDEHDVLAERVELLTIPRPESLAEAHQQQQRPHAPGDPKHGQKRAQLVRP